ncbi:MAG TPA: carboxyl transferase domain-containing protein [Acidimicrobiales bacterium]|jgi:acetyl-CoA carboxylase carboxyltransferase component
MAVIPAPGLVDVRAGVDGTVRVALEDFGGRQAVVARTASDRRRGALARRDGDSLAEAARLARRFRRPLVLQLASSGADVADGIDALHGWGAAAAEVAACSGVVPIIAVATGPVISGPALLLGLADVVVMTSSAVAFVSGPSMVEAFTGVRVDLESLGGTAVHAAASGLCAIESDDPDDAVAELLGFLPDHADEEPPRTPTADPSDRPVPELREVVPARDNASYDVRDVIGAVADDGVTCELWGRWAPQLVTTLARMGGAPVGVVASQPRALAGTLDIVASQKGARFVRFCDAFNLPIVTLVDTPGFLPGKDLEWRGMIRHGAELAFAYAEATVPRICVILRKAFGGAYIVMDSKGLGNDVCLAWPGAEIAVMGAPGAVQILHRRADETERGRREEEYRERFLTPWPAAERGFVDGVIDPADTRSVLTATLAILATKRERLSGRKHDGGPL